MQRSVRPRTRAQPPFTRCAPPPLPPPPPPPPPPPSRALTPHALRCSHLPHLPHLPQEIDGDKGYFVNCVDFDAPDAKLRGFRVVVKGKRLSDTEVQLYFRRVKLLRRSRWLKSVVIPLPPSWLQRATDNRKVRGLPRRETSKC